MINNISKTSIEKIILAILKEKFDCTDEILTEENHGLPLTWNPFNLSAIQLMYFLLEIEKICNTIIPETYFHEYGFSAIENVIEIVYKCKLVNKV